jgi:hypothetical protein
MIQSRMKKNLFENKSFRFDFIHLSDIYLYTEQKGKGLLQYSGLIHIGIEF